MWNKNPKFLLYTGPMYGSKTTKLLARVDRFKLRGKNVIAFKPRMDNRYSNTKIQTHNGIAIDAIAINTGDELLNSIDVNEYDVIAVDEAFMIPGISKVLIQLFRDGKSIIVSSLELSASCGIFEEIRDIMPWCTFIHKCPAVCMVCGEKAYYTHRKIDSTEEIVIGGSELYEPRCWQHHNYMNFMER